jgi:hypothetical protein
MPWSGMARGFEHTKTFSWLEYDIHGYIAKASYINSVYVLFRGSESMANWKLDFKSFLDDCTIVPECDCKVHAGL